LSSFQKTNGYATAFNLYTIEWQADIIATRDCYKAGDPFEGIWRHFGVVYQPVGGLDTLIARTELLRKGTRVRLRGTSALRNTEKGWRIEDFSVKTWQSFAPAPPPVPLETQLGTAAEKGDLTTVRRLLSGRVNVNATDKLSGQTVLMKAVSGNHLHIVKLLLAKGAKTEIGVGGDGETPLIVAARDEHLDIVQALLAAGAKVDAVNAKSYSDGTALYWAAQRGNLPIVQLLIAKGADVNGGRGQPPLLGAAMAGSYPDNANRPNHLNVIKFLLDNGADVSKRGIDQSTSLIYAVAHQPSTVHEQTALSGTDEAPGGSLPIVLLLLEKGADVNLSNDIGWTALMYAANHGHLTIVDALLVRGASIAAKGDGGFTPLMLAAEGDRSAVVKRLLEKGADPNVKNEEGKTALDIARIAGAKRTIPILKNIAGYRQESFGSLVVGSWQDENSLCTYRADGSFVCKYRNGAINGSWRIEDDVLIKRNIVEKGKSVQYSQSILMLNEANLILRSEDRREWTAVRVTTAPSANEKPFWQSTNFKVTVESLSKTGSGYVATLTFENLTSKSLKIGWEEKNRLLSTAVGPYLIDENGARYFAEGYDSANIIRNSMIMGTNSEQIEIPPKGTVRSRFVFSGSGSGTVFQLNAEEIHWPAGTPVKIDGLRLNSAEPIATIGSVSGPTRVEKISSEPRRVPSQLPWKNSGLPYGSNELLYGKNVDMPVGGLQNLIDDVEAGETITIPIRLNSGAGINNMVNAAVSVTKGNLSFSASCCWGDFTVSYDKVLDLKKEVEGNQGRPIFRLRLKVLIKNKKGDKEDKKDFYFYNTAAQVQSGTGGYGPIICAGCDDSLDVLLAIIMRFRNI